MKWVLLGRGLAVLVLVAAVVTVVKNDKDRVSESSTKAFSELYAKNVALFYNINSRFPTSAVEVSEQIFGSYSSNYNLVVLDATQKVFLIRAGTKPNRIIETWFQLSSTGLVCTLPVSQTEGK